jgi:DNA polymerase-1
MQIKELLFSKEGFAFPKPKESYGKDADSTDEDNLKSIKDKTGFLEQLIVYRKLQKVCKTYLVGILEKLDQDHYIHSTFNQHVTKTGRLSARNINLQNIITRTDYKAVEEAVVMVKKSFTVPKGYIMVQADYSQIELRIIAFLANETTMLQAYRNNQDLHELTASNSRGFTLEEFKKLDPATYKQYRYEAKAENFGFIYMISPQGFKEYARTTYGIIISEREAEKKQAAFFKKYPKLLDYHKEYIHKARKFGYIRTFFGRCVHLPDINSINGGVRGHAERNAVNSPVQGTAGEMTIWAFTLLSMRLNPRVILINSIHDSIIFYIPNDILEESKRLIQETMGTLPLKLYFYKGIDTVPITAEFETSTESWKDLK